MKALPILTEWQKQGARGLRRKAGEIALDDSRRKNAREAILSELESLVIVLMAERDQANAAQAELDATKAAQADEKVKAIRKTWSKAGSNVIDALQSLGVAQIGVDVNGYVDFSGQGNGRAVARIMDGYCAVSVPVADRDAFKEKYQMPDCLEWQAEDRHVWCMADVMHGKLGLGIMAPSVKGNRLTVATGRMCPVKGEGVVTVPVAGGKFIVPPSKALPAGGSTLAPMPETLTRLLAAVAVNDATTIDRTLIG